MDVTTIIAIVTIVLGIIGTLAKLVWDQSQRRLDAIEADMGKLITKAELDALKKDLDLLERQLNELGNENHAKTADLYRIVDSIRESLADARETIAGFGSTYISRKEHREVK